MSATFFGGVVVCLRTRNITMAVVVVMTVLIHLQLVKKPVLKGLSTSLLVGRQHAAQGTRRVLSKLHRSQVAEGETKKSSPSLFSKGLNTAVCDLIIAVRAFWTEPPPRCVILAPTCGMLD